MSTNPKGDKQGEPITDIPLGESAAESIRGGDKIQKADGSLDAGLHFKYDIKAQKQG